MRKCVNVDFFLKKHVEVYDVIIGIYTRINECMKPCILNGKVILWFLSKVTGITKLNIFRNYQAGWSQIPNETSVEQRFENVSK